LLKNRTDGTLVPVKLRAATNQDAEAIKTLVFGVLDEYGLCADPGCTDADLDDIEGFYSGRGGFFDVLVNDKGRVVGSVGLCRVADGTCELRKMYLDRSVRRQGHGRRLLEHALRRARELGYSRVVLETALVLKEATRLYERHGFRPYTPEHKSKRCDVAYALDLAAHLDPGDAVGNRE
jgi:GNAT superfamily N-acetyltransferase